MTEATYKILACDGGGIFGVITAKLLQSLDRSVLDNIDLFAGNSTGSIIALGLASGVSIDTIFDLYSSEQACSQIFQPYLPSADQDRLSQDVEAGVQATRTALETTARASIPDVAERLRELAPLLLFPKYRSEGLRELLTQNVPDMTLAEVWTQRRKRVVAPSFQLSAVTPSGAKEWRARLFNNLPNIDWMPDFPERRSSTPSWPAPPRRSISRPTMCLGRPAATPSSTAACSPTTRAPRRSPR